MERQGRKGSRLQVRLVPATLIVHQMRRRDRYIWLFWRRYPVMFLLTATGAVMAPVLLYLMRNQSGIQSYFTYSEMRKSRRDFEVAGIRNRGSELSTGCMYIVFRSFVTISFGPACTLERVICNYIYNHSRRLFCTRGHAWLFSCSCFREAN